MITEFYVENNTLRLKATPTSPASRYEFGLLWYHNTYKKLTTSVDIQSLIQENATEDITITAAFLGLTALDGIFYVQLFDNQVVDFNPLLTPLNNSYELGVATNLGVLYKAFLDSLESEIDIFDCDCVACLKSTEILTKIEAIKVALTLEDFTTANIIFNKLYETTTVCENCDFITVATGYNIGTFNDIIKIR
tara:strand:- start:1044 stop:1622 length:579 start_codon:yes stop_codon:yes gene_type:complete